ncbi:hypothetical protein [Chryseobacterium sp.]|jgi:hypothetical protein|uniref:hypothetical protein n=1 Tax=Chryseobacterium sp. TaxID=1871047 RepID=UPI002840B7CC|nr:hypothetical protein [Chryseobacterium sp.]MDR3025480.1 hypothetical protein [Chryseobacterium sp.]
MNKINRYEVVNANSMDDLVKKINNYIDSGWTIHGGILKGDERDNSKYYQIVVLIAE